MSPPDGDRLFPASASNDPGELSKLALHAHHCPLRPLIAMHRVKRQDHAHVASYRKEVHLVAYVVWLNAGNEIGPVSVGDRLARNDLGVGQPRFGRQRHPRLAS
jgi:hypothetical protein